MVDIPGNNSTTVNVTVGSTTAGTLETIGDHDWYRIQLNAGQSISVAINGVTLVDPYLRILNAVGTVLFEHDDIVSGVNRNSLLAFTATTTGTYYLDVSGFGEEYAGDFQMVVSNYAPPPAGTVDQLAAQLTSGYWGDGSRHFNITPGGNITVNLTGLTFAGQTLARDALALWTDVIGVTFNEVRTGGQITFDDNEEGAFSSSNTSGGFISSSHVNVSTAWLADYGTGINSYAFQSYIHEVGHALGLGHGGNYNEEARYPFDARYSNDSWPMTVMSYFDQQESSYFANLGFTRQFVATPMLADVLAISQLYGLSTLTRIGNTTYGFNSNAGREVYDASLISNVSYTIVDSGGVDTLDYSGFSQDQMITLATEAFSSIGGKIGNVSIARGVVMENAIGGSGNDRLLGNAASNTLSGGAGNDWLSGAGGNNLLDGGVGFDAAEFASFRAANVVMAYGESVAVANMITRQTDRTVKVEALHFLDATQNTSILPQFLALDYIAGYDDLVRAFGANGEAGFLHFAHNGVYEGRAQDAFNGLDYLASYDDLISAFGADTNAAARHFISNGYREDRQRDAFNGLDYLASYDDLISAFGADTNAAARHFISNGYREGRQRDAFNGLDYLASYDDLIIAFGADTNAAASHFIAHGYFEGRQRDAFDVVQYIAGYGDLIKTFGADEEAAARHYILYGNREGRSRDAFDAAQYLENYADLRAAYGDDHHAASLHYITHGYFEGRTDLLI